MKAKQYSIRHNFTLLVLLFLLLTIGLTSVNAQCPTVTNPNQSFCDLESLLISDLQATDNGNGIVWYDTATSITPLLPTDGLVDGEDYYADDNTGACGSRERVDVIIYGPPEGLNFQGVCLDDPSLATVADLVATGNDVQWYLTASGGSPLNPSTTLIDETIYYADQANPDTGCRTSRLAVRVNVGLTPVPTGDAIQEFCVSSQFTPTVGDLVASGMNNWYISLSSAAPLDESTPLIDGQTYYATTVDLPCESTGRFEVTVVLTNGPDPGINGTLDLCDTDTMTYDLLSSLGGTPQSGGTWTPTLDSGTNIYDPSIDPPGVYTYTVSSINLCPDASSTVTVTISPQPNAGTNGTVDLCSNEDSVDLFDSLGGTPDTGGTWSPALSSGTGIFDPEIDTAGVYAYTIIGIPPCTNVSSTVTVSVEPFRDAGEDGTLEICNDGSTTDLFNSLGGTPDTGGTWSPALASGTGIFDPSIDTEGTYTYSFSSNAPCPDDSATVIVTVNEVPNAGSNASIEICSNDTSTIDLFNSLGGTPDTGGTWSPTLTSGTGIFDPTLDSEGTYTYIVSGEAPCPNASATVTISSVPEPDAGIDATLDVCSNDSTIDLFNILGGTPDSGGNWSPALTSGTGVFDPSIDPEGTYTYTVLGTPPCSNATATVTISTIPFLNAGTNGSLQLCTDDNPVDLFNSLGGTPDIGGTWSPALASGTSIFNPSVDTAGTYTYTTSAMAPCLSDSATVVVSVDESPDAGIDGTLEICNTSTTYNLFDSLGGTPDAGGVWSPALVSGTNIFDPNVDLAGTYTYTVISVLCNNNSATVTVSIADPINPGENGSLEICSTDTPMDLFSSLGGTPDTGGTWSPTLASGTGIFDPSIDPPGNYTYTLDSNIASCPSASATVTVSVIEQPSAGTDGTLNLCNATGNVDLFDSLAGSPDLGGTWSPVLASGTGVFDPNVDPEGVYTYTVSNICGSDSAMVAVSFTDLNDAGENGTLNICVSDSPVDLFDSLEGTPQPGGSWSPVLTSGTGVFDPSTDLSDTYTYTLSSNGSLCPEDSAMVIVTVVDEPNAGGDSTLNLCNATNTVDLFDSLTGTPDSGGTWSPALASGTNVFDPAIDSEGDYTYTITNLCGTTSATVTVSFSDLNDAGEDGSLVICEDNMPVDLFDSLEGTPQQGGTWSPALDSGTGIFDPSIDSAGTYTYTISNSGSLCPEDSATVDVTIETQPDAGNDGTLDLCIDSSPVDLFDSLEGTPQLGGTWSPALDSGTGIFDPTLDAEGTYTYLISNTCGTSSANVVVSFSELNDAGSDGVLDLCSNDSPVDLFDSLEGTPQLGGTWSPELNSGTGIFDPSLDLGGTYTYTVSNSASICPEATAIVNVTIIAPPNAGTNGNLDICTDDTSVVDLFDSLGGTPLTGGIWSPALDSGTGLFDPNIDSPGEYVYTVESTECGLTDSASVTVTVGDVPNILGLNMNIDGINCFGDDITINITGANQLTDGDYDIVYELSGANVSSNAITISISGGSSSFMIPASVLANTGSTILSITEFYFAGELCNAFTSLISPIEIFILDISTPEITIDGGDFCELDDPTVADLTANITSSGAIVWYDQPNGGTIYAETDPLQDGVTYYASLLSESGCESTIRLAVTVTFIDCELELIIPDGFSPNGDTINDDFHIVNLNELYPNFKLMIYNRYGNMVYEGDILSERWDGTSKNGNKILPVGVYFFILEFNDGSRKPLQGRVYLNR